MDAICADMDTLISDRNVTDSSWSQVTSEIPQGHFDCCCSSMIMPYDIMRSVKMFADDIKTFKDMHTEEYMLILQKDVDSLCDCSLMW